MALKTNGQYTLYPTQPLLTPIYAVQGDANIRFLTFSLQNEQGLPLDLTALNVTFNATKPDGKLIYSLCKITNPTDGIAQVELTSQTLAIVGEVKANITVLDGNNAILTYPEFKISVGRSNRDDAAIESQDEFGAWNEITALAQNLRRLTPIPSATLAPDDYGAALAALAGEDIQNPIKPLLDDILAAIATRAAGDTALTNSTWTDARAGFLDYVNTYLNGGVLKGVQRGTAASPSNGEGKTNVTISSVNLGKSFVICTVRGNNNSISYEGHTAILTSSTNLEITFNESRNSTATYEVVEFK